MSRFIRNVLLVFVFTILSQSAHADLAAQFSAANQNNSTRINHAQWDSFLSTYVYQGHDGVAHVNYSAARRDLPNLNNYVSALSAIPVTNLNRAEQMAFWINLYNALTVKIVLDNYPVNSIKDIKGSILSSGPWKSKLVNVQGAQLSLDDIEHRILRPIFRDNRVHYAVNCASIGCPNLMPRAFTAQNLDTFLNQNAAAYINHPRGAQVSNGRLRVSKIYRWFKEDFGQSDANIIMHLRHFAQGQLAADLANITRIDSTTYDWSLND